MAFAAKRILLVLGTTALGLALAYGIAITPHHSFAAPQSAQGLLDQADSLSWANRWEEARPLYAEAANLFHQDGQLTKALYAEVSETADLSRLSCLSRPFADSCISGRYPIRKLILSYARN